MVCKITAATLALFARESPQPSLVSRLQLLIRMDIRERSVPR
jgi:hypothetical protein